MCSSKVVLDHVTSFGQWNGDSNGRVPLPIVYFRGHCIFLLALLGVPTFYDENNMPQGAKAPLAWTPEWDTWRRPVLDPLAEAELFQTTHTALSANIHTHRQETNANCYMLVRWLFGCLLCSKSGPLQKKKKKYLRLWKQFCSKNSKHILFGVSTQPSKWSMMKGTILVKICRFWLLKIILSLNCLVTAYYLRTYVRAFINVDIYIPTCMIEAWYKVNLFFR